MVDKEFKLYDDAPGFWWYVALSVAADVCENPVLSAKNPRNNLSRYRYDIYDVFEDAVERYSRRHKRGNYFGQNDQ